MAAELEDDDAIGLAESFFESVPDLRDDVLQQTLAVPYFKDRILYSPSKFTKEF
jgi:hypothetical protein